jgi:hypothetical protein
MFTETEINLSLEAIRAAAPGAFIFPIITAFRKPDFNGNIDSLAIFPAVHLT